MLIKTGILLRHLKLIGSTPKKGNFKKKIKRAEMKVLAVLFLCGVVTVTVGYKIFDQHEKQTRFIWGLK